MRYLQAFVCPSCCLMILKQIRCRLKISRSCIDGTIREVLRWSCASEIRRRMVDHTLELISGGITESVTPGICTTLQCTISTLLDMASCEGIR